MTVSSTEVVLRTYRPEDLHDMVTLRCDLDAQDMAMAYPDHSSENEKVAAWIKRKTDDMDNPFLVVSDTSDACLGYVQFSPWHRKGRYAWCGLVISRNHRARGIGGKAMLELCTYGQAELNLLKVLLEVRADNLMAISLFERLGFTQAGLFRKHYLTMAGQACDVIVMEKHLPKTAS